MGLRKITAKPQSDLHLGHQCILSLNPKSSLLYYYNYLSCLHCIQEHKNTFAFSYFRCFVSSIVTWMTGHSQDIGTY